MDYGVRDLLFVYMQILLAKLSLSLVGFTPTGASFQHETQEVGLNLAGGRSDSLNE